MFTILAVILMAVIAVALTIACLGGTLVVGGTIIGITIGLLPFVLDLVVATFIVKGVISLFRRKRR